MAEQAAEENELYLKLQHYFLEFQVSHVFQNMQKNPVLLSLSEKIIAHYRLQCANCLILQY